jgi:hypothetical protein
MDSGGGGGGVILQCDSAGLMEVKDGRNLAICKRDSNKKCSCVVGKIQS